MLQISFDAQLDQAKRTGLIHLNDLCMRSIPLDLFQVSQICRLDLGLNELCEIPPQICALNNLEYLWLNDNPLTDISCELSKCKKLKELDIRNTKLITLPKEIGRLKHLDIIDVRGTPLKAKILEATDGILLYLRQRDIRKQLKLQLIDRLREGPYREVATGPEGEENIRALVKCVLKEFEDNDEVKSLIRNADRLFPEQIHMANSRAIRKIFIKLRTENERKKLGAELELKLRRVYFDEIDPQSVEGVVKSIYDEVKDIEDIRFLIKHASSLFPKSSLNINAVEVNENMIELQTQLANERASAVQSLFDGVKSIYGDVEPAKLKLFVDQVAALFKKSKDIKSLAADVSLHFPVDYIYANPKEIKLSFSMAKSEMMGKTTTATTTASSQKTT